MKTLKFVYCLLSIVLCVTFVSCDEIFIVAGGDDENENGMVEPPTTQEKYAVSGKVEKGPFVSGSTISIQPMSEKMRPLGTVYTSTIQDHLGNFSFGVNLYDSPYADLAANGYFFNEVTGSLSQGTLYLRAIVDLSKSELVNVNIITHIKYQRVMNLIAQGKSYAKANAQAQQELLAAFGLQKYAEKDASQYTIAEGSDESAVLIAISSLILIDRTEAAVTEFLARLCREFGESGEFSADTKALLSADREKVAEKLSAIRENVKNRYRELGSDVEVRNLSHFFDWNDDGTAGNETLKEGESITLSTNRLEVPYSGGSYMVKIESPISVYLEPIHREDLDVYPEDVINPDDLFKDFYEYSEAKDEPIQVKTSINGDELYVEVSQLESYLAKEKKVMLYDCMGAVLDTLLVVQEANPNIAEPQFLGLGQDGLMAMASVAMDMASAASNFNVLEQYYQHNKIGGLVDRNITPYNNMISSTWSSYYKANNIIAIMKDFDAQHHDAYGAIFDVFSAMIYYYMVVGWGDVPYILKPIVNNSSDLYVSRTDKSEILYDMTQRLTTAIDVLKEKKNESVNMTSMNDFFLISKDVARILLSNIHMYQGKYAEAQVLLKEVVEAGYYELDDSRYSNPEIFESNTDVNIGDEYFDGTTSEKHTTFNRNSKELIFVLNASNGTRVTRSESVVLAAPKLVPLMTYTDVMLSYAECLYHGGNTAEAEEYLQKVVKAKDITVTSDVFNGIKDARHQLLVCCNSNFAFYKRNGIAVEELGIESHQQLLPIPQLEVHYGLTQNPGYDSW